MAENKDQLYKELSKRLQEDGPHANLDDLIPRTGDTLHNSRRTRDLLDQFIGNEMMKNTSTPIDLSSDKNTVKTMNKLTEQYSDIKDPNWKMIDDEKHYGFYNPNDKTLQASRNFVKGDNGLYTAGGLVAHEPIHQMVSESGGVSVPDKVMSKMKKDLMKESNIIGGHSLADQGALLEHEIMQAGHLNPSTKTTPSLRNAIAAATGKFSKLSKVLPYVGTALGGLAALGIGNKAMAGDIDGAVGDSAEMVDPVGLVKGAREANKRLSDPEYGKEASKQDLNNHIFEQTGDYSGVDNIDDTVDTNLENRKRAIAQLASQPAK